MAEPNLLLDALIDEAGMSYAGFASRLNHGRATRYDHASVRRWIRDHAIPRGDTPNLICRVLSGKLDRTLTLADIGMDRAHPGDLSDTPLQTALDHAAALWRGDHMKREAVEETRMLAGSAAVAPAFAWENPPDDIDVSHRGPLAVGAGDVARVRAARDRYEQMYRRVGGIPVRPRIVAYLNTSVGPLVRGGYDDRTGRELLRATGGLIALAGISAYDADRQALAQRYLLHALRMAKASGHRGFGGYCLALLANQAMYRKDYRRVLQYTQTALRGADGHLSPALAVDLHTLQAKAYAFIGDTRGSRRHMTRAESIQIRPENEPPETGYVQPGLLETQHAEVLRRLGDLTAAQTYAEQAVHASGGTHLRGQAHRLATLAQVQGERGDAEIAAATGQQMLDRTEGMESGRIHDRVTGLVRALAPYDTAAVREFRERAELQVLDGQ
ncbi:transcriptional regulator [Actinomadura madurae]|uniref:transcriptional regulator n=2 Tax=Actinomadura madurae TaxID=1993 RepID=UPI0020D20ADC|nr:transcriptional regulator [Actinomadura madurae]MCP9947302.1 transcriptional regulator [Actinomadura madurae]MCQ0011964.1 transcriptional regulator [Actinomadura madurae]